MNRFNLSLQKIFSNSIFVVFFTILTSIEKICAAKRSVYFIFFSIRKNPIFYFIYQFFHFIFFIFIYFFKNVFICQFFIIFIYQFFRFYFFIFSIYFFNFQFDFSFQHSTWIHFVFFSLKF